MLAVSAPMLADLTRAQAEDTIGISGRPAAADGSSDGRTRFSYAAEPGQQLNDFYLVSNSGSLPQQFTVLATDAFNDDAGDFALKPTAEEPTEAGAWVRFENGLSRIQFELQPGESRLLPFTVSVPDNARPGDHAAGIAASVVTPGDQVNIDRRLGTRMYVRVAGDVQAGLAVSGLQGSYAGDWWNPFSGILELSYTVENVGNVALASNVSVGLDTWFGLPLSVAAGDAIPELLPGGIRTYRTEVPGIAAWGYLNPWIKLNPFVEGDDATKRLSVQATTRDAVVIAVPWVLVLLLALVALIIAFRIWRRKVDAQRAAAWMAYTEEQARREAAGQRAPGSPSTEHQLPEPTPSERHS